MGRPKGWRKNQGRAARINLTYCFVVTGTLLLLGAFSPADATGKKEKGEKGKPAPNKPEVEEPSPIEDLIKNGTLGALDSIPVPLPKNLDEFVVNKTIAIELGKALFWDMQVGSDGKVACATCHFHAGADGRTKNTLSPRLDQFRGANHQLTAHDFPFHKLADPNREKGEDNSVLFDTSEVVGSQGVIKKNFLGIHPYSAVDDGVHVSDPLFNIDGANARQVTGRNSPTMINAVYNDRNFWDGRANRFFNGVNPFGDMDPDARVWLAGKAPKFEKSVEKLIGKSDDRDEKSLRPIRILLDNASLASQATGPPNDMIEMAWNGRTFPELARKLLPAKPLALQEVHAEDSVLGYLANVGGKGINGGWIYADFVRDAFDERWWSSQELTPDGYTQMEANFSLFWGLSVMLYESTLISGETPFDRFAKGDDDALSESAREGLEIFVNQGKCINCHSGPEFTSATVSQLRGVLSNKDEPMIEFMPMQIGTEAFYDAGFYNIGVRPTFEDLGVGAEHPLFGPLSLTRRVQKGQNVDINGVDISIGANDRVAVDGAFKTPGLRNVELTGPYMHNGGMRTLKEVIQFYARGADFFKENIDDLDPDVDGIGHVRGDEQRVQALVDFMKSLTDDRVRYSCAPFDHPELIVPNGHVGVEGGIAIDDDIIIEAVGRSGTAPLLPFEERLP